MKGDLHFDPTYSKCGASVSASDDNSTVIPLFAVAQVTAQGVAAKKNLKNVIIEATTKLAANAQFIGTLWDFGTDPSQYPNLFGARVYSDQAGVMYLEQSNDKVTWRSAETEINALAALKVVNATTRVFARYARVRYANNALTAQTVFECSTGAFDQ